MNSAKIQLLLIVATFAVSFPLYSIIANPQPYIATQPDGSKIEIILNGDEYFNYYSTSDGIPITKSNEGKWVYATIDASGQSIPSMSVAKSKESRSREDINTANSFKISPSLLNRYRSISIKSPVLTSEIQNKSILQIIPEHSTKKNFRGLVVLVEYNDRSFSRTDIADIFDGMINNIGYTGYVDTSGDKVEYTGSVRDYFIDNSHGKFSPEFDIVGPVKVPYSCHSPQQTAGAKKIIASALDAIDEKVDFADFDSDGDGKVDMIYFIFAGGGSNVSGNNKQLLWPHASILTDISHDGVEMGRYACSTELYGLESKGIIDGIGVICHEFSHVLGLPDLYDVDYATGGQSIHPGVWSIMAGGAYLNSCRTPSAYSVYERYASGFITPEEITEAGTYSLESLDSGGKSLKISSSVPNEFFLLECRTRKRWDTYLPGEGLLVWRVDSTDASAWTTNRVNALPEHCYMELVRSASQCGSNTVIDTDSDPFPGSATVTSLTNNTTPSIQSWTGIDTPFVLSSISYSNGIANVQISSENLQTYIEGFENMPLTDNTDQTVQKGEFGIWHLNNSHITSPEDRNMCSGSKALTMVRGSEAVVTDLIKNTRAISMNIANSSGSTAIIRCYKNEDGNDWDILRTNDGSENISVGPKSSRSVTYPCQLPQGTNLRIVMSTGNSSIPTYIDNVRLLTQDSHSSEVGKILHSTGLNVRNISYLTAEISADPSLGTITIYNLLGQIISIVNPSDTKIVTLPSSGLYIFRQNGSSVKVIFN